MGILPRVNIMIGALVFLALVASSISFPMDSDFTLEDIEKLVAEGGDFDMAEVEAQIIRKAMESLGDALPEMVCNFITEAKQKMDEEGMILDPNEVEQVLEKLGTNIEEFEQMFAKFCLGEETQDD